jgi:transposase
VTEVAEGDGVSRKTVHAWFQRYWEGGLVERPHRRHRHPDQISTAVEVASCESCRARLEA